MYPSSGPATPLRNQNRGMRSGCLWLGAIARELRLSVAARRLFARSSKQCPLVWAFIRRAGSIVFSTSGPVIRPTRTVVPIYPSRHNGRMVRQRQAKDPSHEEDKRRIDHALSAGKAYDVTCLQAENAKDRQHEEWVEKVWQCFSCVVDLYHPTKVHLKVVRSLHDIRSFNKPLTAPRGQEEAQNSGIDTDTHW